MVTATTNEQDTRLNILNTLLTTPHRKLDQFYSVHQGMIAQDPLFYVRLAAWYNETGEVRDHKEMFIINLCLSGFEGHRDVGLALLRELPPYQLTRVVDFIHGRKKTKKIKSKKKGEEPKTVTEEFGLNRNVPRSVKTEITRYLHEREADTDWFDGCAAIARHGMKRLYALLHIPLGDRAKQILFDENPPEDSKLFAIKQLAKASTPAEQAQVIMQHKIPYRVASTIITAITPTVLMALIEVMSDQEIINSLGALRKRGAFDNPDLKALIEQKLQKAQTGKNVSALKTTVAVKAAGVSEDIAEKLQKIGDTQIKARGQIKRDTALLIDKSGSMSQAIELGKQIASMISAVSDKKLYVYAYDSMAYPIICEGKDLASWEKALKGISASGGTSCGVALEYMIRNKQAVEQIIQITDEGENTAPAFGDTLKKYMETLQVSPNVCIVKTQGAVNKLEADCKRLGIAYDIYQFTGDYYSLPGLIPFLTRPNRLELLMDIMSHPLPQRKPA